MYRVVEKRWNRIWDCPVKDIWVGSDSYGYPYSSIPRFAYEYRWHALYFGADDGVSGFELWKSDGRRPVPCVVKDISPGIVSTSLGGLTSMSGSLYFSVTEDATGSALWKATVPRAAPYVSCPLPVVSTL